MSHIRTFFRLTHADLRAGRESWRVLVLLWTVALVVAVASVAVR